MTKGKAASTAKPAVDGRTLDAYLAHSDVVADRRADVLLLARCTLPNAEAMINRLWFDLIGNRFQKALAVPDAGAGDWISEAAPALSETASEEAKAATIAGLLARLPLAFDVVVDAYGRHNVVALAGLLKNFATQAAGSASRPDAATPRIVLAAAHPEHDQQLVAALRAAAQVSAPPFGTLPVVVRCNPVPANIALQVAVVAAAAVARHASGLSPDNPIYRQVASKCEPQPGSRPRRRSARAR